MTEKQHWKSNNLCLIEETTGVSLYGTVCTDMDFIAKQLNDKIDTIERLRKENEELKDILKDITIQLDANHTMNTYQMVIPINKVIYNELNQRLKEI